MDPEQDAPFAAERSLDGGRLTVAVSGEIDMATAEAVYAAATDPTAQQVILDLGGVTFFDSAGVRVLLRLADNTGELTVRPSTAVRRVLELTGLASQEWVAAEEA